MPLVYLAILAGFVLMLDKIGKDSGLIESDSGPLLDSVTRAIADALTPDGRADAYIPFIDAASARYGLPEGVLFRVLYRESRFRPDIITGETVSARGAQGIAQFMPATANELRVNPLNPESAIDGAARYLARLYESTKEWPLAVAAYNWGPGNLARKGFKNAPKETRDYVSFVFPDYQFPV